LLEAGLIRLNLRIGLLAVGLGPVQLFARRRVPLVEIALARLLDLA